MALSADTKAITASAPGKVLLVGGYLVLHRPHHALIAGASARFHTTAEWEEATCTSAAPASGLSVRVTSPQFHSDTEFRLAVAPPHVFDGGEPPSFIALAIRVALLAAGTAGTAAVTAAAGEGKRLHLTLRADNDFYSQLPFLRVAGEPVTADALKRVPAFQPPPTEDALAEAEAAAVGAAATASPDGRDPAAAGGAGGGPAIRKTGLGSSAALTVSLTAAFARALGILPGEDAGSAGPVGALGKAWLMRCGQVSHGLAQGKVGSGFDVSAAVLGTQLYLRVSRDALADAMGAAGAALRAEATEAERAAGWAALAGSGAEGGTGWWDLEAQPAGLPSCVDLLLADVSGGSSTPSMVRRIEAWRTEGEAQAAMWEEVASGTRKAQRALAGVAQAEAQAGADAVAVALAHAAATTAPTWSRGLPADGASAGASLLLERLAAAAAALASWRALMRRMGEDAGVPIEPASQTALLEATQALPGVMAVAVPGAGGFDAIYVLCVRDPAVRASVEACWLDFKGEGGPRVVPLLLSAEPDDLVSGGVRIAHGSPSL